MKTITHPAGNWLPATKNYALLFGLILTICVSAFGEDCAIYDPCNPRDPNYWWTLDWWVGTAVPQNGRWCDPCNWATQYPQNPNPPDSNTWACIPPSPLGPKIMGDATCSRFSVYPWSWSGAGVCCPTEVNVGAGLVDCGVCIDLAGKVDFDDSTFGTAVLNVYGGTMITPAALNWGPEGDTNGLWVGGSMDMNNVYNTAVVNIYGGLVSVPRIAIYNGQINLYGGVLEGLHGPHTDTVGADHNDFYISDLMPTNRLNVAGGTLILAGNWTEQVNYYIQQGRICPFGEQNSLSVVYYSGSNYTSVKSAPFYVDNSATGANNGTSWANAYKYLQNALTVAGSGTEIWVAQGTYRPDEDSNEPNGTNDRNATFQLKNGVALYGGFPTGGGIWSSRNPNIYETILSGDLHRDDEPNFVNRSDNSYHVVTGSGISSTAILDGFTITAGNANGSDPYDRGAGMVNFSSSPTLTNCIFTDNRTDWSGGGMFNDYNSNPMVNNCTFSGNSASSLGGGMFNFYSHSPMLTNCTFISNSADVGGGIHDYNSSPTLINCFFAGNDSNISGGMYNYYSNPMVINCTFSGNSAAFYGGGMYNISSSPTITNCNLSGNSATYTGGGMYNGSNSSPTLANCILWGNTAPSGAQIYNSSSTPTVSFSDVQGGWSGTGNINANPLFVDADGPDNIFGTQDDNLRLSAGSPCIDAGDNNAVPEGIETDLDGLSRFFDDPHISDTGNGTPPIVDIGAYEYQPIIYVDANATGGNNGSSWVNAYNYLQDALYAVPSGYEIWVAQGTYRPDEDINEPNGTDDPNATFQLENGVALYGGFPTGGGLWASRNPNTYKAILSGDIGVTDNNSDNSYHVVTGSGTNSSAVLDGFTITAGNANGSVTSLKRGGGMYNQSSSPTVTNCTFSGNSSNQYGGGMYNNDSSNPTVTNCTFSGNSASHGGGMWNDFNSRSLVTNCIFSGNSAPNAGGGMVNNYSSPIVTNCTFNGNLSGWVGGGMSNQNSDPTVNNCAFIGNSAPYGGGMYNWSSSNPTLTNCTFSSNSATYYGGGMFVDSTSNTAINDCNFIGNTANTGDGLCSFDSIINIGAGGSVSTGDEFYISGTSRIQGTGSIVIGLGGELIIDSNAIVDLNDPNDPNIKGTIQCDGLLKVKFYGQLKHATVNVSRQAGGYFGKFQVEGSAQVTNLDIYSDGDRFMDVDPCFTGTIANNRIYVTITQGQNGTDEGVLELRGLDLPSNPCDFNDVNVLGCHLDSNTMPAFDTNSWTLERLEVAAGAKVTLVDLFDSGNGYPEVLYVKNLVLGANCVLNIGFEHLYYQELSGDPNSIKKGAVLGFSLGKVDFDSNAEYQSRVSNNNYIDPADPNNNKIRVERVVGQDLDPNGIMTLRNFGGGGLFMAGYGLNGTGTSGQAINARAKARFAECYNDKIRIRFNYLFDTTDTGTYLMVYLSDVPELLDLNDPGRAQHYLYVGQVFAPPTSRPGSAGSGRFGNFDKFVSTGGLYLWEGTWVELELFGSASSQGQLLAMGSDKQTPIKAASGGGSSVSVDDWDAGIYCYGGVCLDVDHTGIVSTGDFLKVVSGTGSFGTADTLCLDGGFTTDGYTDDYDAKSWDWTLNLNERKNLCGQVPLSGGAKGFAASGFGRFGSTPGPLGLSGLDDLLISGKRGTPGFSTLLTDQLYVFNSNYLYLRLLDTVPNRCNVRIVRGTGDNFYQVNSESGVLRLDNPNIQIVPPGQIAVASHPRYTGSAMVYVGIQGPADNPYGRPILDAAFDANYVYVVPVVIVPDGNEANAYTAAAKFQLNPYQLVKLYDGPLLTNDNQRECRNNLRDIELDAAGNVFVTNANVRNESDILWKFEPNDFVRRLNLSEPNGPLSVRAPSAMYVSTATNTLYLTSSIYCGADHNSSVIYGLSPRNLNLVRTITISGMQHITSITEDPVTKSLWVAGFNFNSTPNPPIDPTAAPFYSPYMAKVPPGENNVSAGILVADDLAMPLSICWTGALPPPVKCGGADLNKNGTVTFQDLAILAKYWLRTDCPALNCEGADLEPQGYWDGDVDLFDLDIMADYWLNTNCQ